MQPLSAGPVFLSGRQHSGNTVLTLMLGRAAGCYAQIDENDFFDRQFEVDGESDPEKRLEQVMTLLRLEYTQADGAIRATLAGMLRDQPSVRAIELYITAMHIATIASGNTFWAQKATSYIFHVDTIFAHIPRSRMVYLLRSPHDIAASRIRRDPGRDNVWAPSVAWNHGIKIAHHWAERAPDRFRILRYEDMVNDGRASVGALFDALGIAFTDRVLDVPRVNQSKQGRYSLEGTGRGLTTSNTNTYMEVCSRAQLHAIDAIIDKELVERYYPDLPHRQPKFRPRRSDRLRSRMMRLVGPLLYAREKITFHREHGGSWWYVVRRSVVLLLKLSRGVKH